MKSKTQIQIGRWTAVALLILSSLSVLSYALVYVWAFHINPNLYPVDFPYYDYEVLSVFSYCLVFAGFIFAVGRRLFKTSLFLLILFILLIVRNFSTAEYYHPALVVFQLVVIFLLSQGIVGVYKEKNVTTHQHMSKDNK